MTKKEQYFTDLFQKESVQLLQGDCINVMTSLIKDKVKVDAIITDPPYNISKENNFSTMKNAKRQGVDFGEWDKGFDLFAWIDVADKLLKDGGNIIIFNSFLNIGNIAAFFLDHARISLRDLNPSPNMGQPSRFYMCQHLLHNFTKACCTLQFYFLNYVCMISASQFYRNVPHQGH